MFFFLEDLGVGNFNSFSGDAVGFIGVWFAVLFEAMANAVVRSVSVGWTLSPVSGRL